jgi:Zn-dependent M28 family amino/carboxypeptidase
LPDFSGAFGGLAYAAAMNLRPSRRLLACVFLVLLALLAGCTPGRPGRASSPTTVPPTSTAPPGGDATSRATGSPTPAALRAAVTVAGIRAHLAALQAAADRHSGNRAAGTPGYDASVDYVVGQLRAAGYTPVVQRFQAGRFRERSRPLLELVGEGRTAPRAGTDYRTFEFSGSGDITAAVRPVDLRLPPGSSADSSTSGCEPADFASFPRAAVALLQRGTCPFAVKVANAERAGAAAAVIFNEGQPGRTDVPAGTLGGPGVALPVLAASFELGRRLAQAAPDQRVRVRTDTESTGRPTSNVVVELPGADPGRVIMGGAHLDSVAAGPGINDNASGSATLLEIARRLADTRPAHTVRFAWWGAEELGLLGSRHYVGGLDRAERDRIALYLNLDMVGSPNFRRLVYDGDGEGAPAGSTAIERVLTGYLRGRGLAVGETSLRGGSDHATFAAAGIPVGGLFTGAGEAKSAQERDAFGGTTGPADPCYHARCDDLDNLDLGVLDQMADAAATAVATFARDPGPVDRAR